MAGFEVTAEDLVMVVKSPPLGHSCTDMARYYVHWRAVVGKTVRVVYVDENGRPELDIREFVQGVSISVEPECVSLVEVSTLSTAEKARLIESV